MSKVGGLQFSRPAFDWDSKDKLTELGQFKADCHILFSGPFIYSSFAFRKVCNRHGHMNHFESKCRSSKGSKSKPNTERSGKTKGKFSWKCDMCGHKRVNCLEYGHDSDSSDNSEEIHASKVQDLSEQIQSLFYQ